jgi:hypothetical protein
MNKVIPQNLMPIQFCHYRAFKTNYIPSIEHSKFGIWKQCYKMVKIQAKGTIGVGKKNSLHHI